MGILGEGGRVCSCSTLGLSCRAESQYLVGTTRTCWAEDLVTSWSHPKFGGQCCEDFCLLCSISPLHPRDAWKCPLPRMEVTECSLILPSGCILELQHFITTPKTILCRMVL